MRLPALALMLLPTTGMADMIMVKNAVIPVAPPTARAHAAYMELHNNGTQVKALIGVMADRYAMAHLHMSEDKNGVAMMSAVEQIDIAPNKPVVLAPGGLHIMLMRPDAPVKEGETVAITLEFADGTTKTVSAAVTTHSQIIQSAHSDGS